MNAPDDKPSLVGLTLTAHGDPDLPCFACFMEALLDAACDLYTDRGADAYDDAMHDVLGQMGQNIGAVMAALGPSDELRREFIAKLDGALLLHGFKESVSH